MGIAIIKAYNFNFLVWNCTIEKFTTKVVIPKQGFINYNKYKSYYFALGRWLITIHTK